MSTTSPKTRQFVPSDPLNGIIAHLTRHCGGNVHERGVVTVNAKSAHCMFDLKSESYFTLDAETSPVPDHGFDPDDEVPRFWLRDLIIDFHELRIIPTHYTICFGPGSTAKFWDLRGWQLEDPPRSGDDTVIHHAMADDPPSQQLFEVSSPRQCRFLKFCSGTTSFWPKTLVIKAFEVFGTLVEPST
jgi:hypothetical protein